MSFMLGRIYRALPADCTTRKVLIVKGLVYGLPDEKIAEAYKEVMTIEGLTTVVWDGDPLGYTGPLSEKAPSSFTRLIHMLGLYNPNLEFIFFKKDGKEQQQFFDKTPAYIDETVKEKQNITQYIGPLPFIKTSNTTVLTESDPLPPFRSGRNYAIRMDKTLKWHQLGLKGLEYLKQKGGVETVHYLMIGQGYAVKKELEELGTDASDLYPERTEIHIEYIR